MVKKILERSYLFLVLAFLYAPIIFVMCLSFAGDGARFSLAGGFSIESYTSIFTSDKTPALLDALKNTMLIAVISSVISTILGTVSAIGMFHLGKKMSKIVNNVNQLPIINSEIVMAVSFMLFFTTLGFPEGYVRLIIGHVTFCTPYVVLAIMPRLYQIDPNIYEAALDLGATPAKALFKIQLPMILPNILSGFVLSFTLSMDDFIITQINKGTSSGIETLSTYIYEDAKLNGLEPFWFSIFTIIFVVVLAVLLVANLRKKTQSVGGKNAK